jgi:hypothetical protein
MRAARSPCSHDRRTIPCQVVNGGSGIRTQGPMGTTAFETVPPQSLRRHRRHPSRGRERPRRRVLPGEVDVRIGAGVRRVAVAREAVVEDHSEPPRQAVLAAGESTTLSPSARRSPGRRPQRPARGRQRSVVRRLADDLLGPQTLLETGERLTTPGSLVYEQQGLGLAPDHAETLPACERAPAVSAAVSVARSAIVTGPDAIGLRCWDDDPTPRRHRAWRS